MAKITEMRKYQESDEYKTIVEKCKNRAERLEGTIIAVYDEVDQVENDHIFSAHDINWQRRRFCNDRIEEIKSEDEGALILKNHLQEEVERIEKFVTVGMKDQYGMPNSSPVWSALDMDRAKLQDNLHFDVILEGIIAQEEEPEKVDDEVYES